MKKVLAALAAGGALSLVPIAMAGTGTPIGPGGCHMLTPIFTPSPVGLDPMMTGSANGTGTGAANMQQMLLLFSNQTFCGL